MLKMSQFHICVWQSILSCWFYCSMHMDRWSRIVKRHRFLQGITRQRFREWLHSGVNEIIGNLFLLTIIVAVVLVHIGNWKNWPRAPFIALMFVWMFATVGACWLTFQLCDHPNYIHGFYRDGYKGWNTFMTLDCFMLLLLPCLYGPYNARNRSY